MNIYIFWEQSKFEKKRIIKRIVFDYSHVETTPCFGFAQYFEFFIC